MVHCLPFSKDPGSINPSTNEQRPSPQNEPQQPELKCTQAIRVTSLNHRAKNIRMNKLDPNSTNLDYLEPSYSLYGSYMN